MLTFNRWKNDADRLRGLAWSLFGGCGQRKLHLLLFYVDWNIFVDHLYSWAFRQDWSIGQGTLKFLLNTIFPDRLLPSIKLFYHVLNRLLEDKKHPVSKWTSCYSFSLKHIPCRYNTLYSTKLHTWNNIWFALMNI